MPRLKRCYGHDLRIVTSQEPERWGYADILRQCRLCRRRPGCPSAAPGMPTPRMARHAADSGRPSDLRRHPAMPVCTDLCQASRRSCGRQAVIRADTHHDIASSLVDDFAADHCHHHNQVAQAFDTHPAEVVGEDDDVDRHADLKATLESFIQRREGPWTSKPLPTHETPR
jgi:hypothetical protein